MLCVGLTSFQQSFSHIATVSCCDRELNVHFYSADILRYEAQTTPVTLY